MRQFSVSALAIVAVGILTGCGDESGPSGLTAAETITEYRQEAATLELPPGWSWPDELNIEDANEQGSTNRYQPGYAKAEAGSDWYCAWSHYAISATDGDRSTALDVLDGITETYYYQSSLMDDGRSHVDSIIAKAQAGDLGPLADDVALNCRPPRDFDATA